jgi:hypothetical protein
MQINMDNGLRALVPNILSVIVSAKIITAAYVLQHLGFDLIFLILICRRSIQGWRTTSR